MANLNTERTVITCAPSFDLWGWKGSELVINKDYGQYIKLHTISTRVQISGQEVSDLPSNSASLCLTLGKLTYSASFM